MFLSLSIIMSCLRISNSIINALMQRISQVVVAVLVIQYLVNYISRQKERVTYFQLSSVRDGYKPFFQEC